MKINTLFSIMAVIASAVMAACGSGDADADKQDTSATENTSVQSETEPAVQRIDYDIDPSKPVIALTFDDGPNNTTTVQVLDLLDKYQVRASFFLVGNNITESTADTVKRAYDMGCEINNHSKTHGYMNKMDAETITEEVNFVSDKVMEITGEPTRFFRPPFIAVSGEMYDNIDMPFICGVGCNDWDNKVTVRERIDKTIEQVKDGTIILLHDSAGNNQTVEALDTIIPQLLAEGYQFATVSELFEAKGIEISGDDTNMYTVLA
ncbi:MAG: polysaccharide deacetylase family protein [Huintestinicola sp.]